MPTSRPTRLAWLPIAGTVALLAVGLMAFSDDAGASRQLPPAAPHHRAPHLALQVDTVPEYAIDTVEVFDPDTGETTYYVVRRELDAEGDRPSEPAPPRTPTPANRETSTPATPADLEGAEVLSVDTIEIFDPNTYKSEIQIVRYLRTRDGRTVQESVVSLD